MKALKVFITILIMSVSLFDFPVCEAQYMEIIEGIGKVVEMAMEAREKLKPLLEKKNETVDENAVVNKKLDEITTKIESLEKEMMSNFQKVLKELDKIPGETVSQYTASKFETYMQTINKTLGYLISKKQKVNRGELVLDDHFRHDVDDFKTDLDRNKENLEVIMQSKEVSLDFLGRVKNKANVCNDKMTQMQLLDSFRALYVDTVSRYLIARHIVISLWESADKTSHEDKKRELNSNVRDDLLKYLRRFQELMENGSREFQLCSKPTSEYVLMVTGKKSGECYFTKFSNKIVEMGPPSSGAKAYWDYVSLQSATARPGYVIVGAKIEHNLNILYIKVIEAKLLPNGIIDPTSITYNEANTPGFGEQVVKLDYRQVKVDITETIVADNRVITGLRFAQTDDKRIYLEVQSTQFDLEKGTFVGNPTTEPHQKGSSQFQVRSYDERDNPITRNAVGLQTVAKDQYLEFVPGGHFQLHPALDLDDVFPTPLTLLTGASLYVREVEGTEGYLSIRLHTLNIAPHVAKINFDLNDNFEDVLKAI